ncbi:MAG TPA: FG-GAP-like repeat-containing protein, partial [Baekduia sp.]|nr:FG-GAP-like repeat-containing protein [Baekduia sp.]
GAVSVLRAAGAPGAFVAPLGSPFGLGTAGGVGAIALGDVNGDGRADVLATIGSGTTDNDQLVPLAGDGSGDLAAGTPITAGEQLAGVALADLDGDGDLDALTASTTAIATDQLGILEQSPSGLALAGSGGAASTQLATAVVAGDLDGDAVPDALVVSRNAGTGSAWVAAGAGLSLTAGTPVDVGADPVAAALADVDGDGDRDGLVLDGSGLLTVLRNDGAGGLTPTGISIAGLLGASGLAAGDLNGDGAVDVVVTDGATASAGVLLGDGAGGFGDVRWVTTGAGARSPVIADLTGDGVPDLATADASADAVSLVRNASAPVPHGTLTPMFGSEVVGRTGAARAVTITNTGAARLVITGVTMTGDAADDFLLTHDDCTGASIASDGSASCTVRVRFAPSAAGARTATLRLRYGSGATYDLGLAGTGAQEEVDEGAGNGDAGQATAPVGATPATSTSTPASLPAAPTPPPVAARPAAKRKPARLILTLSHRKLTAASGQAVRLGFALGRAGTVVLRVKRGARTVEIVRVAKRGGRGAVIWDGRLGAEPAPAGRYRLDLYAVAADGRAARASVALMVEKPGAGELSATTHAGFAAFSALQ